MTEREKIIDILNKNFTQEVECTLVYTTADGKEIELPQELCDIFNDIVTQAVIPYFADALIAAGIGDVSKLKNHRVIAEYSLVPDDDNPYIIPNVPLRVTQLYGDEEVEQIVKERDTYKRALKLAEELGELCAPASNYIQQAEKELAEEGKDENN